MPNLADPDSNALARFEALSAMFDSGTRRYLLARGLRRGWHCLEVGAGGGSIAQWLSKRVGAKGQVVATDIDTRFVQNVRLQNLKVWRHDIARDPLPRNAFDLVHTRMTLIHLPERDNILKRLVASLKLGGWIVVEEFDALSLLPAPSASPGEVSLKIHVALHRLVKSGGLNPLYGRLLFGRFRTLGLQDIGAEGHLSMVQNGTPAATLLRASCELRRTGMVGRGYLTDSEFDNDLQLMGGTSFVMPSPILWTAWGRKCA